MLDSIFPRQFDNNYRGHRLAIWLLIPIVFGRLAMGTNTIINTRLVATTADGIPLDSFGAAGAETVLALFAIYGLFVLLFALQGVVVLVRYRSMIPFMYLLLLLQQLGGKLLGMTHHIARTGVPTARLGSAFILAILAMTLVGFVLSLLRKPVSPGSQDAGGIDSGASTRPLP